MLHPKPQPPLARRIAQDRARRNREEAKQKRKVAIWPVINY
jgi:hypothetical protein